MFWPIQFHNPCFVNPLKFLRAIEQTVRACDGWISFMVYGMAYFRDPGPIAYLIPSLKRLLSKKTSVFSKGETTSLWLRGRGLSSYRGLSFNWHFLSGRRFLLFLFRCLLVCLLGLAFLQAFFLIMVSCCLFRLPITFSCLCASRCCGFECLPFLWLCLFPLLPSLVLLLVACAALLSLLFMFSDFRDWLTNMSKSTATAN